MLRLSLGCVAFLVVSVGCSGAGQQSPPGVDGGADAVVPLDATTDDGPPIADSASDAVDGQDKASDSSQPKCNPVAPFGTPVAVAGPIDTPAKEGGPHLTADELTMYFSRAPVGGTSGLFVAHRTSVSAPWETAIPLTTLDETSDEYDPTTSNELGILFTLVDGGNPGNIWGATRASVADPFGAPSAVAGVNSGSGDITPFLSADGAILWFASSRVAGNGFDIYRAPASGASFATPVLVPEVSTSSNEYAPTVSPDGLVIFLSSDRPGALGGQNDADIWIGTRASVSDSFSGMADLVEVNSTDQDYPGWVSTDGCRLYMSSLRSGQEDIYVATRGR